MAKPETSFRLKIEKNLPARNRPYREKMANPYRGGTADSWYSGDLGDLWVEYKFLPSVPQRGVVNAKRIGLTALQLDWLKGRYEEGRNVCVIVGTPAGGVIMRDIEWDTEMSVDFFRSKLITISDLARWIAQQTLR